MFTVSDRSYKSKQSDDEKVNKRPNIQSIYRHLLYVLFKDFQLTFDMKKKRRSRGKKATLF